MKTSGSEHLSNYFQKPLMVVMLVSSTSHVPHSVLSLALSNLSITLLCNGVTDSSLTPLLGWDVGIPLSPLMDCGGGNSILQFPPPLVFRNQDGRHINKEINKEINQAHCVAI